jgi:ABC-type multidrug transport system fused ATPase/permease subunit
MMSTATSTDHSDTENKLYHALKAIRRYFSVVYRLGADIFGKFPAETLKILAASAASLSCQILALGLLFAYVRALESNQLLYGFTPRTSASLFAIVASVSVFLFIGFALFEYRSNIAILRLCRRYQNLGTQEALSLSSKLPHWFTPGNSVWISTGHLRQILSIDVHHRSRMTRILLRAIIPVIRLVLSAIAVLYINLHFSVLIFLIIGVPIAGLYFVGRKIADTITSKEMTSQNVFRDQMSLLSKSWEDKTHISFEEVNWDMALGGANSRPRLYFRRLRAKVLGKLLINTANTLGIIVLILSLGFWMLQEPQNNWSLWLTYLIALRFFLSSLNRVAQALIQTTRFNRQVRRFMEFLNTATWAVAQPNPLLIPCPDDIVASYRGTESIALDDDDEE